MGQEESGIGIEDTYPAAMTHLQHAQRRAPHSQRNLDYTLFGSTLGEELQ